MKKSYIVVAVLTLLVSIYMIDCTKRSNEQKYPDRVGDIDLKKAYDESGFQICGRQRNIRQYYNFGKGLEYQGDRRALHKEILTKYKPPNVKESGWIRIRFVVNCKGESGGFELLESDENYQPFAFNESISSQLMSITKSLSGWKILPGLEMSKDYYQYLIFKISNGQILEILP